MTAETAATLSGSPRRRARTSVLRDPRLTPQFVVGVGMLLAIALWRRRAVPRWAAAAVGAFPIVGLILSPAGAALAIAGFGACALTLRRGALEPWPVDASARLAPART